jgi:hypothetical protein
VCQIRHLSSDFRIEKLRLYFILPYLLKCTSNLFLKHDVENEKCEITVKGEWPTHTAKWGDILKLYKGDKRNVYCQLPKVTDSHFKPGAQNMMTGSLAAWVMSSTGSSYQHSGHNR